MITTTRREILGSLALAAPALLTTPGRAHGRLRLGQPFTLGVASGDPWPDGVVLWTRLAPHPMESDGGMPPVAVPVQWQVAEDPTFTRIVRQGVARAEPADAHSVHVEVSGLRPGRAYHYRFLAGGESSPVGRTRTAPAFGAAVDRLRLCFGSCQKTESGHYAGWRHLVAEDPDLIVFLGDYIYETAPDPHSLRPHPTPEPFDVAGYRQRYATYKLDPLLQAAHAAAPWAAIWDDHEVANDYAGQWDQTNGDPVAFLRRRAAAYQVYWEHMPLRAIAHPSGPSAKIYRTLDWGNLAQFQLIDDRQYRGSRACQRAALPDGRLPYTSVVRDCAQRHDATRTMLGGTHEAWLLDALGTTRAQWNLLTQQSLMTPFASIAADAPQEGAIWHAADRWEGYPAARDRILRRWSDAQTPNPVVLSGDIHVFVAAEMRHPDRPDGPPIAAEFVGGSLTSLESYPFWHRAAEANPGVRFTENRHRGYARMELTAKGGEVAYRGLADARDPNSPIADIGHFALEPGKPGIA
jgi:alkaline phosphatase D